MRAIGWWLTVSLFLLMAEVGLNRQERERTITTPREGVTPGYAQALDGHNGVPPTPKP